MLSILASGSLIADPKSRTSGAGKLTEWENDGEQKHGLSVVAYRVLSVYAAGKARRASREEEASPA